MTVRSSPVKVVRSKSTSDMRRLEEENIELKEKFLEYEAPTVALAEAKAYIEQLETQIAHLTPMLFEPAEETELLKAQEVIRDLREQLEEFKEKELLYDLETEQLQTTIKEKDKEIYW